MLKRVSRIGVTGWVIITPLSLIVLFLQVIVAQATPIYVYDAYSSSAPHVIMGNPTTGKVYIGRSGVAFPTGDVIVIDDHTGSVVATLPTSDSPTAIAVNQTTNKIYVVPWAPTNKMYIIDGASNELTEVLASSQDFYRTDVEVSPATNKVYLAGYMWLGGPCNTYLSIYRADTFSYAPTLDLGEGDYCGSKVALLRRPDTDKIYVTGSSTVSVVNGSEEVVSSTIPVGLYPIDIVVNSTTQYLYVANSGDGTVSVIDGLSDSVVATVTVGITPTAIALNPMTNRIYVANSGGGTVSVIDGASNTVIDTVNVGGNPSLLTVDTSLNRVYVGTGDRLKTIDGETNVIYEPDFVYQPEHIYYNMQDLSVMASHKVYVTDRHNYDDYGWWYILADIDLGASTIEAAPISIPADNISQSTITVTLRDSLGVPVSGVAVSIAASGRENTIIVPEARTDSNGQMTGLLRSSVQEEKTITATLPEGKTLASTTVMTFTSPTIPNIPLLVAPQSDTITTTQSLTLMWQASEGASPTGYNLSVNGAVITTTGTISTTVLPLGVYTWTVRAYNATGYSTWATPQSILVIGEDTKYATIDAMTAGIITATTNTGITTTIQIPAGVVSTTTQLLYTPVLTISNTPSSTFAFTGYALSLNAYQNGRNVPLTFTTPITVSIEYTDNSILEFNESALVLYYWNDTQWESDGIVIIEQDIDLNRIVFTIEHLSDFALFGQKTSKVFLPLVTR